MPETNYTLEQQRFVDWLTNTLQTTELPQNTAAILFNLYDGVDEQNRECYQMELVATASFDADDETGDWGCDELFATRDNLLLVPCAVQGFDDWEQFLEIAKGWVVDAMQLPLVKEKLLVYKGVAVGFVDGDLEILYRQN